MGRGSYIQLYQSFRDPQTSAIYGGKEHPFMVYGPISHLSSSGAIMRARSDRTSYFDGARIHWYARDKRAYNFK